MIDNNNNKIAKTIVNRVAISMAGYSGVSPPCSTHNRLCRLRHGLAEGLCYVLLLLRSSGSRQFASCPSPQQLPWECGGAILQCPSTLSSSPSLSCLLLKSVPPAPSLLFFVTLSRLYALRLTILFSLSLFSLRQHRRLLRCSGKQSSLASFIPHRH